MGFFLPLLPLLLVSLSMGAPCADAWGYDGHFMICTIAEKYLTGKAREVVQKLLLPEPKKGGLAAVCSWADQYRDLYPWSAPLHYVNPPDGVCEFDYSRDCHNDEGQEDMCVVGAIINYTSELQTYGDPSSSDQYNLTESLKFLAHFMGDVHQPLHVGFKGDKGSKEIAVRWFWKAKETDLHWVWDTAMIKTAIKSFYNGDRKNMIASIEKKIVSEWADDITVGAAIKYASESITLSCDYAYKDVEKGSTLRHEYLCSRLPIVETRIAQAALRLATWLNEIFDPPIESN